MRPNSLFCHAVFFYMAEGASSADAQQIAAACHRLLSDIPGVRRLQTGTPAGTPRAVVDNSYGVALYVELEDAQAHDIYQQHPNHLRFIEENKALWSRVQVYDFITSPE